ncbi:MAG: YesL family protein [Lachnospiraceae bacterium]|nr:YesL family protein [Lachnospiraceae bacterium]
MRKFFSDSNPIIRGLTKLADLMWLNFLYILTSIPIFTIGAATAALYSVTMKVVADEESYITKDYFKAFISNFKQATVIWIICGLLLSLFGYTFYVLGSSDLSYAHVAMGIIGIPIVLIAFTLLYAFPIMSKFENTTLNTAMNSLLISLAKFPITVLMLVFSAIPILLVLSSIKWVPLLILCGFSMVAYVNGSFMNKFFDKIIEDNGQGEESSLKAEEKEPEQ